MMGLDRVLSFRGRGVAGDECVTFFMGGGGSCSFYIKKLTSETFKNKKGF